jgi:2-C-methyl-D-erythritol 2,4-cyclodiphosphate synthase
MVRIGFGYDVHAFTENKPLFLGGIPIPYEKGLEGHSDADVLLHAICDALLGAAALRDIGFHFPNTDPQWKNISSLILLQKTWEIIQKHHYELGNIDSTILAEAPKISPFIPDMQKTIANVLQCSAHQISIKATTNEKMGFIGRKEGIAAMAVALLILKK